MADMKEMVSDVKSKISIPMYFYNVIVPQRAEYYSDYTVDFDVRPVAKCPIHDEDTPSMRFYEETNTFYCFGCRAGGDVINLHREFMQRMNDKKPSFDEAVKFLYEFFIQGNDRAQRVKLATSLTAEESLSTKVEMMMYNRYTSLLESRLSVDKTVSSMAKRDIYTAIDNTDLLVSKNKINAQEAVEYIKSVVMQTIKWWIHYLLK